MGKLDGHCLCGQVTYTVTNEDPIMTAICHCTECQRQTGTAFSIVVAVDREDFAVEGASLSSFQTVGSDHGLPVHRHFCSNCGSPIVSLMDLMPDLAFIKAGTLDDASWLEVEAEAWCDSAQPWSGIDQTNEARGFFPRGLDTD
jgi:hypothetical protein